MTKDVSEQEFGATTCRKKETIDCVINPQMAVNIKDLDGNRDHRFKKIIAGIFNKKHFTSITWFVLVCSGFFPDPEIRPGHVVDCQAPAS